MAENFDDYFWPNITITLEERRKTLEAKEMNDKEREELALIIHLLGPLYLYLEGGTFDGIPKTV